MENDAFYPCSPHINYRVTISGGFVSWSGIQPPATWCPKRGPQGRSAPQELDRTRREREKARKRSIGTLASNFNRLQIPPKWFITLTFDRRVKKQWSVGECMRCFSRFRRYLERGYPTCWFFFVMEFSRRSGPHFHLIGRIGKKPKPFKQFCEKWLKITNSSWAKAVDRKEYNPLKHLPYVTKKDKAKGTHYLMRKLQGKSFWGCIHRKKMKFYAKEQYVLCENQMALFRISLHEQIVEKGGAESSLHRLRTDANRLCYCTQEMLQKALRDAQSYKEVFV